jgi:hypothetical protein
MPVLESSDAITPRSALRHRPIGNDETYAERRSAGKAVVTPIAQRASRLQPRSADSQVEIDTWQRVTDDANAAVKTPVMSPSRRINTTIPKDPPNTLLPKKGSVKTRGKRQAHPLLYLGMGMLGMLVLWTILTGMMSWVSITMDDLHYGRPRTFQTDHVVGHHDSAANPSHFIAFALHGHIEVIEMPGGDATHARIFLGPQLLTANSDLVVVTLSFADVNNDGKPDMLVTIRSTGWFFFAPPDQSQFVFVNENSTFVLQHG